MTDALKAYRALMKRRPDWFTPSDDDGLRMVLDDAEIEHARAVLGKTYAEYGPHGTAIGVLYDSPYYTILRDVVQRPDGSYGGYIRVFNAPDRPEGVWILPTIGDDIVLTLEYRHAVRGWRWLIPRGFCDPGETGEQAARRELKEELNAEATAIRALGVMEPDNGSLGSKPRLFHAEIETFGAGGLHDEAIADARRFTRDQLKTLVSEGNLIDGPTLGALGLYWALR